MRKLIIVATALAAAGAALLASCSSTAVNPYYDESKPHHSREGFRNNYAQIAPMGYWTWQWQRLRDGLPKPPKEPAPRAEVEADFLKANATEATVTWLGHAGMLVQVGSYNILADPQLSERASPLSFYGPKRRAAAGLTFEQLPHIDIVLISHNHYDHMDLATVTRLAKQDGGPPLFVVPLGLEKWMRAQGIGNVVELDWWDRVGKGGLDIFLTPVQHWSQRTLWDRNQTLWGGFFVKHRTMSFFFAGDTGYSQDFTDIRKRLGEPDLAILPIGGYEPRWFMEKQHIDPTQAVQIHKDLGARYSVGMHWGVFELTDESLDEPPQALSVARVSAGVPAERFFVMKLGETRRLGGMLSAARSAMQGTPAVP